MLIRGLIASSLCMVLGAQSASGKKDPLAEALGRASGKGGVSSQLGSGGIEVAFKGARTEGVQAMASEVVGTIGSLTADAEQALADLDAAKAETSRLWALFQQKQKEVNEYMAQYRQGLFCSVCGKTKAEIERRGETFPHTGQHVVVPTQEQIRAKERELQPEINEARAEWAAATNRVRKLRLKVDELLEQIPLGHSLWCTAATYVRNLVAQARAQEVYDLQKQLEKANHQLNAATDRLIAATTIKTREEANQAKTAAQAQVDQLRSKLRSEETLSLQEASRLAQIRKDESGRIAGYLDRPHLRRNLELSPTYVAMGRLSGADSLGGRFLMGRLPSDGGNAAPLTSVLRFIAEFRACDPDLVRMN